MTPPTLVDYQETAYNTAGTSKTVTISWEPGDFIVCMAGAEGATLPGAPTGTGLNFSTVRSNSAASSCASRLSVCNPQTSGSSIVVTCTEGTGIDHWGFSVWVWRNTLGGGQHAEQHTATKTVAMTPSSANCGVCWAVFDFGADPVQTITPTPTNEREKLDDGTRYTIYVADLTDQSSGGSTSYGISGGAGVGPFSILVMEVMSAPEGRVGGVNDDRQRSRDSHFNSHTSTLIHHRSASPDDSRDLGWRDAVADNRSRMI